MCVFNIESALGRADPLANDENFLLCMLSLEELGATGNKVCCYDTLLHASERLLLSLPGRLMQPHVALALGT